MLRNFEKWIGQDILEQRENLNKFMALLRKKGVSDIEEHVDYIMPHFIVNLDIQQPEEKQIDNRDPWTISSVLDDQNCAGSCKYQPSESPRISGIKVEYVLGTLVARLVDGTNKPVSLSTHLHSQKFDSKRGINVENFEIPLEELVNLIIEVKKKLSSE